MTILNLQVDVNTHVLTFFESEVTVLFSGLLSVFVGADEIHCSSLDVDNYEKCPCFDIDKFRRVICSNLLPHV